MCATIIIEFELAAKHQLMFQAWLQGEDGLALVRCIDGVQQLWTTTEQEAELLEWLESIPDSFKLRILERNIWQDIT